MKWILPEQENENLVEWIYKSRDININDSKFFNPQESNLYSPLLINDVQKVADELKDYIGTNKKIVIHGDFDVDGVTATSIMWQFLYRDLKLNVVPYIPSRFTEGYGLSDYSISKILEMNADLIITVDCGVKDIELVEKYKNKIDFVITDHHTLRKPEEGVVVEGAKEVDNYLISSSALAVCHPKLNNYPFPELCGAAVSWKMCSAVNEILDLGVDMTKYLDLVAIGTVCDIMPLQDENRTIVKLGLNQLKNTENTGIKTLLKNLKINPKEIDTYHLGYILGPRINATGRLEDAMDSVRLLTTQSIELSEKMSFKLDSLNSERQQLTKKYIDIAEEQILHQKDDKLYFVSGMDWPEGIIGLIAGKLTEKYSRPVIAASITKEKVKGSARSIEEFHIANALNKHSTLLLSHGGHSQAAGLSLLPDNLDLFVKNIKAEALETLEGIDISKKLLIDGISTLNDINEETYKKINNLSPFGMANKKPLIALLGLYTQKYKLIGKEGNHLKLSFIHNDSEIEGLAFNKMELYSTIDFSKPFDLAGYIELNEWNGNSKIFLKIEDLRQ